MFLNSCDSPLLVDFFAFGLLSGPPLGAALRVMTAPPVSQNCRKSELLLRGHTVTLFQFIERESDAKPIEMLCTL
jgi:hypothetical protein